MPLFFGDDKMTQIVKGARYYYNPNNGAVYEYAQGLDKIKGLVAFAAKESGEFTTDALGTAQPVVHEEQDDKGKKEVVKKPEHKPEQKIADKPNVNLKAVEPPK